MEFSTCPSMIWSDSGGNCTSAQSRRNAEKARREDYLTRANWAVPEPRSDKAVGNTPSQWEH